MYCPLLLLRLLLAFLMVIQTMLSSAPNGNPASDLARQPSIYSLTLEEIQTGMNEPGKAFGSMNMEEFMRNLWTAEESQSMASSAAEMNRLARQPSLQRFNSHCLPTALSRKTVEDVWTDIQRQVAADPIDGQRQQPAQQKRQLTLGEMTLEDFLSKAGAFKDDPKASSDGGNTISLYSAGLASAKDLPDSLPASMEPPTSPSSHTDWMCFSSQHQHQQTLQRAEADAAAAKRCLRPQARVTPLANSYLYDGNDDSSGLGQASFQNTLALSSFASEDAMHGRKRSNPEALIERTMDRRQKRMIKNRESAARSRARKQAYTDELEAEITNLKNENAMLKQRQAFENGLPETMPLSQLKIRVLRRARSW